LNQNEPKPKVERPSCPPDLSKVARKEWRRIVPILEELQIVARLDRAALSAYCESWARWREAENRKARRDGKAVWGVGFEEACKDSSEKTLSVVVKVWNVFLLVSLVSKH
jgi:phage terminase small subunit